MNSIRPRIKIISKELIEKIVDEAMHVLQHVGVIIDNSTAIDLLSCNGCKADNKGKVYISSHHISKALNSVPSRIEIFNRNGELSLELEGDNIHFDPGSAALNILDWDTQKQRKPVTADLIAFSRLTDALPHFTAQSTGLISTDVPEEIADRYRLFRNIGGYQAPHRSRWNIRHWKRSINAMPRQHYRFQVTFSKMYFITTVPFGADVISQGKKLGTTPLTVFAKPDSLVNILISKQNFRTMSLQLGTYDEGKILLSLESINSWQEQHLEQTIQQKRHGAKRLRLYSSIAFCALSGISTIYFRNQADNEYRAYMQASTPSSMKHYYDRTEKFDTIASVSYTLFQIGFTLTGYFFLTSRSE